MPKIDFIKKITDHNTQIKLRYRQRHGNARLCLYFYVLCSGNGELTVQNGISHSISGLDYGFNVSQIIVKHIEITIYFFIFSVFSVNLHSLNMASVIVPPTTHLIIHIFHFGIVLF